MFKRFSPKAIDFLINLGFNNEKSWFEAHKSEFQEVLLFPMKELAETVFESISSKYGDRGFTYKVSRIYKDARYLRAGDGPYRTSLWFSIEKPHLGTEWTDTPVFWFDLSPETWSYGMGYGGAKSETMAKFRAKLEKDPKSFEDLIACLEDQTEFTLGGEDYVRKKNPPSSKTAAWYNKKSFFLSHRESVGEDLFSPDLAKRLTTGMSSLIPIYDYLMG